MKWLLLLILTLSGPVIFAQRMASTRPGFFAQPGSKPVFSMQVQSAGQAIRFGSIDDFRSSKAIPAYYRIHVESSLPWVIMASIPAQNNDDPAGGRAANTPLKLRYSQNGHTVVLSAVPQVILQSTNSMPENDYTLDLIIDPPFDAPGDYMTGNINFELSPQ